MQWGKHAKDAGDITGGWGRKTPGYPITVF